MDDLNIGFQRYINRLDSEVTSVSLLEIFAKMKSSSVLKELTEKVLQAKTDCARAEAKLELPAVIISADTKCRKVSQDDKRTGLIYIDLDIKDHPNIDLVGKVKGMSYDWLIGYQKSPSGGVKVLCSILPSKERQDHLRSFMALDKVFTEHGLSVDQSCKDLKRTCYINHDPDIGDTLITPFKEWQGKPITPLPEEKRKTYKAKQSSTSDLTPDDEVSLCLQHIDPDIDYGEWITVGMAIHSHGGSLSTWDAWSSSGSSYKQGECEKKWKTFSGDAVKFGTLVSMAKANNGNKNPVNANVNKELPVLDIDRDLGDLNDDNDDANAEELEIYHFKDRFWMLDYHSKKYIGLNSTDTTRRLRSMGYSGASNNGELSAVDRIKDHAIYRKSIDYASPIAGRSIGLFVDESGKRFLISSKNQRVEPVKGSWDTIRDIVEGMLREQSVYFYSWLHVALKQLRLEQYTQGHVLALAGQPNCGKSLTSSTIIQPLLGSVADPTKYLTGKTDFNADLVSAELLLMDDKGGKRTSEARVTLAHSLKDISASSHTVSCHGKGKDAFTVHPLWRLVVCMNDDDQSLCAFPAIGEGDSDSVGDKVLLLKCFNDTPLPFASDIHQSLKLKKSIKHDLPGFAYHIENYIIPNEIMASEGSRFGFREYHHPELLSTINQNSNERTLLSATDDILFGSEYSVTVHLCKTTNRQYWKGTAEDWSKILRAEKYHGAHKTINGELAYGITAQKAGKCLARVSKVSDGRVIKADDRDARKWIIWEPKELDIDGDPF